MNVNYTAVAILLGFILVAGALYISNSGTMVLGAGGDNATSVVRVTDRHLYGSKKAPAVIVEFSDFQCPYCAKHHPTLKKIVDESNGQIAWEYRHFPLPSHPLADDAAVAAECVAKHLGNEQFWKYTDKLFSGNITEAFIKDEAVSLGLNSEVFDACKTDEHIKSLVSADLAAVNALGINSTPSNVIIFADGSIQTIPGALPYNQLVAEINK